MQTPGPLAALCSVCVNLIRRKALLEAGKHLPSWVSLRPEFALGGAPTFCHGCRQYSCYPTEVCSSGCKVHRCLHLWPWKEQLGQGCWEALGWVFCQVTCEWTLFLHLSSVFRNTWRNRRITEAYRGTLSTWRSIVLKKISFKPFAFIKIFVSTCGSMTNIKTTCFWLQIFSVGWEEAMLSVLRHCRVEWEVTQ